MFFSVASQHSCLFRSAGFVMPKTVFCRLTNGELKLDYTEATKSPKLSREDKKKNAAQNKSLTSEEVGIYKL